MHKAVDVFLVFSDLRGPSHTAAADAQAQTLSAIKVSHHFDCGTVQSIDDWNGQDMHGDLSALGGEICRAVAVAILGDANGLTIHAFPGEPEALAAMEAGTIQLVAGVSPSAATSHQIRRCLCASDLLQLAAHYRRKAERRDGYSPACATN